jgi:hypothetical protein
MSSRNSNSNSNSNDLSRACYPVPPNLAQLLEDYSSTTNTNAACSNSLNSDEKALIVQQSLTHLLENAIHALDEWYFGAPPHLRSALAGHRTCLRLSCSNKSITITDLGVGMTRADLINILGVGRPIPPSHHNYYYTGAIVSPGGYSTASSTSRRSTIGEEVGAESGTTTRQERIWNRKRLRNQQLQLSSRSTISITSTIEEDEEDNTAKKEGDGLEEEARFSSRGILSQHLPPKEILGGFYAAVCALGVGVKVGTKVGTFLAWLDYSFDQPLFTFQMK